MDSLYRISVKELYKQAHVARSTFYSYYDNVMQLKEQVEDNLTRIRAVL